MVPFVVFSILMLLVCGGLVCGRFWWFLLAVLIALRKRNTQELANMKSSMCCHQLSPPRLSAHISNPTHQETSVSSLKHIKVHSKNIYLGFVRLSDPVGFVQELRLFGVHQAVPFPALHNCFQRSKDQAVLAYL